MGRGGGHTLNDRTYEPTNDKLFSYLVFKGLCYSTFSGSWCLRFQDISVNLWTSTKKNIFNTLKWVFLKDVGFESTSNILVMIWNNVITTLG